MPRGAVRIAALLTLAFASQVALAAPVIDVRARTRVSIDRVVRTGEGVHIDGTVVDSLTGEGVSGRRVEVNVDRGNWHASATSGGGGHFHAYLILPTGAHAVFARFAGDDAFGESATQPTSYDVDRASVTIDVRVDGPVDASTAEIPVHVALTGLDAPGELPLTVDAGDASDPSKRQRVATVHTDNRGEATVSIPREKLGRPGEKSVRVSFDGSDSVNPADASATFVLGTTTRLTDVKALPARVAFESDITVTGHLLEADGAPVVAGVVALENGSSLVKDAVTDASGAFTVSTPARALGVGPAHLTLLYDSRVAWRRGTRMGPFIVEVATPEPVPLSYSLLTFALTAGAVLAYILLRARPWLVIAAVIRRRRRKPESATSVAAVSEEAPPAPGLRASKPGILQSLRRATDHGFTGRVCDVVRGQPIGAAVLVFSSGEERLELVADADGHFETELSDGWWQVEVTAHGYVTETIKAPIPHRGELRGARIDLLPVREKIFAIYRQVAAPLLPKAELWGVWTPREIFDHARAARPGGAFGDLTSLVEETYFSVRTPDETMVATAQAGASAAASELAR